MALTAPCRWLAALVVLWATCSRARADVSETGSFATHVPIDVPAFHGIEPHVALSYDSRAGNGLVGVGWRLDATSYITRNGPRGSAPRFDSTDVFALDGMELVACGAACTLGGTYETRIQSFQRIRYDASTNRWTRWQPNGVRFEYAPLSYANGSGTVRWALDRVVDTHGNTVSYGYVCDGTDECYLDRIVYAEAPQPFCVGFCEQTETAVVIELVRAPRPDTLTYGTGASVAVMRQRLAAIDVRVGGLRARAYALDYVSSSTTSASVLRSVQQFARDATVSSTGQVTAGATPPLPAVTFTTEAMAVATPAWVSATQTNNMLVPQLPATPGYAPVYGTQQVQLQPSIIDPWEGTLAPYGSLLGDFNADGRTDAVAWAVTYQCDKVEITALLPDKSSPVQAVTSSFNISGGMVSGCRVRAFTADVNADGRDDIIFMNRNGALRSAISDGAGHFALASLWGSPLSIDARCAVGDVDLDGTSDLACVWDASGSPMIGTARSNGAGGFTVTQALVAGAPTHAIQRMVLADVNGDMQADAVVAVRYDSCDVFSCTPHWHLHTGRADGNGGWNWYTTETKVLAPSTGDTWELLAGDLDGDGRSDLVLDRVDSAGDTVYVATSPKGLPGTSIHAMQPAVTLPASTVSVGDMDGDGFDDLLTGAPAGTARSQRNGTLAAWSAMSGVAPCDAAMGLQLAIADVNADGKVDTLCTGDDASGGLTFMDRVSPPAGFDMHRWMPADVDGDGRMDLVYVHFKNPGYQVYVLRALAGGGWAASDTPISGVPGLDDPNAAAWMAIDVGGGTNNAPDGKADLVLVDRNGPALRVYTLLSTGSGWSPKLAVPWGTSYFGVDVQSWRPADIDGDGRSDLVHFVALGTGMRIEMLRSNGDGTWASSTKDYFKTAVNNVPAMTAPTVNQFRAMDVNGDGLTDFVHVEYVGGTAIRTLVSNGDGTWRERSQLASNLFDRIAARGWRAMDVNGDGYEDLAWLRVINGCLDIQAWISDGNSWHLQPVPTPTGTACAGAASLEDTKLLRVTDVNGDGRSDIVHISRYLDTTGRPQTAAYALVNDPRGTWRAVAAGPAGAAFPDGWAFVTMDLGADGTSELVHVYPDLASLRLNAAPDRISTIDNGRGARTGVSYRALTAARTYLPPGMAPAVVDAVRITDAAYAPALVDTTSYTYSGATWSDLHRRLLGFERVAATHGARVDATSYVLDDQCSNRVSGTAVQRASDGAYYRYGESQFISTGSAAPYTCLVYNTYSYDCELGSSCSIVQRTYQYDTYGNITWQTEHGLNQAGERQTWTPVVWNTTDYIVDRPAYKLVYGTSAYGVMEQQSLAVYQYDGTTSYTAPGKLGELSHVLDWNSTTGTYNDTSLQYDAYGNLVAATNPSNVRRTIAYDGSRHLHPVQTCEAALCTTQSWDDVIGAVTVVTDPNGRTTRYDYDQHGRLATLTAADGKQTRTSYLAFGMVTGPFAQRQRVRTEITDGSSDGVLWREELHDGLGRVYRLVEEAPGSTIVTESEYGDASSRPARVSQPHEANAIAIWTTYVYDDAERLARTILPDGNEITLTRDVGSETVRDPGGHERTTLSDELGRVREIVEPHQGCAGCKIVPAHTMYYYDARDKLRLVRGANLDLLAQEVDSLGNIVGTNDPDRGDVVITRRADGHVTQIQNAKGEMQGYYYDAGGRLTSRIEFAADGSVLRIASWFWDVDPQTSVPHGDSRGRVVRVQYTNATGSGSEDFWYDAVGRVTRSTQCIDTTCVDIGSTYDVAGRLRTLTYPDAMGTLSASSEQVTYSYDDAGRVLSVSGYVKQIRYDAEGHTTSLWRDNGAWDLFTYDANRGWLATHQVMDPSWTNTLYSALYTHDADALVRGVDITNPKLVTHHYSYDAMHRLLGDQTGDPLRDESFQYDELGRITGASRIGSYQYTSGHLHAVTSTDAGHTRDYDATGNVTSLSDPSGRNLSIEWGPTGMPEMMFDGATKTTTTMSYDADDRRVKKATTAGTTLYFGRYVERDAKGGFVHYYYAGDRLIARRDGAGTVGHLHQDHTRSTRLVTDGKGAVANRYDYTAYGAMYSQSELIANDHTFAGGRGDDETSLAYLNARFYDGELGQFLSADSLIPNLYRSQAFDRYAYTENDPVNYWDPSGHQRMPVEARKMSIDESKLAASMMFGPCPMDSVCIPITSQVTITTQIGHTKDDDRPVRITTIDGGFDADGDWAFERGTMVAIGAPRTKVTSLSPADAKHQAEWEQAEKEYAAEAAMRAQAESNALADSTLERLSNKGKELLKRHSIEVDERDEVEIGKDGNSITIDSKGTVTGTVGNDYVNASINSDGEASVGVGPTMDAGPVSAGVEVRGTLTINPDAKTKTVGDVHADTSLTLKKKTGEGISFNRVIEFKKRLFKRAFEFVISPQLRDHDEKLERAADPKQEL